MLYSILVREVYFYLNKGGNIYPSTEGNFYPSKEDNDNPIWDIVLKYNSYYLPNLDIVSQWKTFFKFLLIVIDN